jgi:TonB family protein
LSSFWLFYPSARVILPTILLLTTSAVAVAQSSAPAMETTAPDPVLARIERARALAAAHQLRSAASELESIRASVNDAAVRNITTLMLMGIYLEEGNYVRPTALLDEAFQQRATQKDDLVRTYFALAGQAINGVRARLARYRSFGIRVGDANLPHEAVSDLDQVRLLLEKLVAQANEATNVNGRAYDAWALKEDVLGIRLSLARDMADRERWQAEYSGAREKLASRQIQIASIGRPPALETVTSKLPNPFSDPKPTASPDARARAGINAPAESIAAAPNSQSSPESNPAPSSTEPEPKVSPSSQPAEIEGNTVRTGSLSGRERKRIMPQYPQVARNAGVGGVVRVFVLVDERGKVTVKGSEGPIMLRQAAEDAARGWTFLPTMVNNKLLRISGYIDFEFKP